jgi:PKD repeat protein
MSWRRGCFLAILLALVTVMLPVAPAMAAQPSNDDFAAARVVTGVPYSDTSEVTGATLEAGEPVPSCRETAAPSGTVWYAFTPAQTGTVKVARTAGFESILAVYTGSSLATLAETACQFSQYQPLSLAVTAGQTYYLQIGVFFDQTGTLQLDITPPPANDEFANATPAASLPFSDTVDLSAATTQASEPSPSCVGLQNTVWYAFTPATTGSVTATIDQYGAGLGVYTGSSLANLSEAGCSQYPYSQFVTFRAQANTTYYFQVGAWCCGLGPVTFHLDVAPNPVAQFSYSPADPSIFDTVQFQDNSYDPASAGIASQAWRFGDGATADGCCPAHQYAVDGDYTAELVVTTTDGRTASASQAVQVRTHDVAIVGIAVPKSAHVGQTIAVNVTVANKRYPETVQVDLYKSAPGGFQQVGSLTLSVPVRPPGGTSTRFAFSYTITQADKTAGKVSFKAVASIIDHRDALPADNELISAPLKIT